ncbi:MAG: protein kinase [Planctomycetes bacterium]|nr:protein kinase [Planctomycetota bacterium]
MIDFTCPACGFFKAIDDRLNGRKWRCPQCNAKIKHRGGSRFQIREKGNVPDDDLPEVSIDPGPTLPPDALTGTLLGHYRLTGLLGSGSGGQVYLAEHETLKRKVAVKVLPPALVQEPEKVARLAREAVALAKVDHPHVVQVFDFGTENNAAYLAMQYVDGPTLSQALRTGPFSNDQLLKLARDLLSGLEAIHEAGLLHRDIKPSNVLMTASGEAMLADFGLAWDVPEAGKFSGSADYAAPELALGQAPDARSDLYSLGGTIYRVISGRAPFSGGSVTDKLKKQIYEPLAPPKAWDPQLSPQIDELLRKLLSKERDDRPASAKAALELLAAPAAAPVPAPAHAPVIVTVRSEGPPLRPILVAGGVLVAALIAIVIVATQPAAPPPPELPPPLVVVPPLPRPPVKDPTPKIDVLEKADLEHLQHVIATQPIPSAIQACAEFLDKHPKSRHVETVLLKKVELHQELDRQAGKTPASGRGLWTFRMKSGGRIQAPVTEELPDAYMVKVGDTTVRLPKEDIEQVLKEDGPEK